MFCLRNKKNNIQIHTPNLKCQFHHIYLLGLRQAGYRSNKYLGLSNNVEDGSVTEKLIHVGPKLHTLTFTMFYFVSYWYII